MKKQKWLSDGFTLVEVLAALALAGIILPVAMHGVSLATATSSEARRNIEAAILAESKLMELCIIGDWSRVDLSGDFGPEQPDYRWEADVRDWDGSSLREVTVSVEWLSRGIVRDVTLSTLAYTGD